MKIKMLRDEFVMHPQTGPTRLNGDEVYDLPDQLASSLIGRGYAVAVVDEPAAESVEEQVEVKAVEVEDVPAETEDDTPKRGRRSKG